MAVPPQRAGVFTLGDIPGAMAREGWSVGAALMRRWLAAPAWTMPGSIKTGDQPPPIRAVDTTIVTMTWATRFARVATARQKLVTTWARGERLAPSTRQIGLQFGRWLASEGRGRRAPFRFGDLARGVAIVDRLFAVNREIVDSPWYGDPDDLYAALGRALVKLAISGEVTRSANGGWRIAIDEVGTYIRDTYDFNGDQPLGSWGSGGLSRVAMLAPPIMVDAAEADAETRSRWTPNPAGQAYWSVDNASFRRFRARSGRGGDFVVLSDVRRSRVSPLVVVEVSA